MKYLLRCHSIRTLTIITFRLSGIVLLFVLMSMPIDANSDTVYALLIIMDADPNIGKAMKANRENVETLLTTIQDETDLQVKTKFLLSTRNETRKSYIKKWLEDINPGDNDVVFVYFSGFGGTLVEKNSTHNVFLYLQDGKYSQTDFAQDIQEISKCRLKVLITDQCKGFLKSIMIPNGNENSVSDKSLKIKHLFTEHEGFLHLSSVTPGEYGWINEESGGLFTDTLIQTVLHSSVTDIDMNTDGFITWSEMFDVISEKTEDRFQLAYPRLSKSIKKLLQEEGSTSQSPMAYALAKPSSPPVFQSDLWTLDSSEHTFTVSVNTDRPHYQLNDYLTLGILVTDDAHVIILNWDSAGELTLLFPNSLPQDNFLKAGTKHTIPNPESDFDFIFLEPIGMERLKVIAIRDGDDSKSIIDLFPKIDNDFQSVPNHERMGLEEEILAYLRKMKTTDWTVANQTVEVHASENTEPPNFSPPIEILPDYGKGDTVYIKDGDYMYFGKVTAEVDDDSETVAVNIFNKTLSKKLGDAISSEFVLGKRVKPQKGWGKQLVMLSFYRNDTWTFTTNVVIFEDYFLLPEVINREKIQGSRKVKLTEVRIPIPIPFYLGK